MGMIFEVVEKDGMIEKAQDIAAHILVEFM